MFVCLCVCACMCVCVCVCLMSVYVLGGGAGHSSLSFSGNSYIKYRLSDRLQTELKLNLRIRTLQSQGIIMYTHTEPCIMLKVHMQAHMLVSAQTIFRVNYCSITECIKAVTLLSAGRLKVD